MSVSLDLLRDSISSFDNLKAIFTRLSTEGRAYIDYSTSLGEFSSPRNDLIHDYSNLKSLDKIEPLEATLKQKFERAMNADFSFVKIHTGAYAESITRERGALAVTKGSDIFFSKGAFLPDSFEGIKLLAHELQHVVQSENGERMVYLEDVESLEFEALRIEKILTEQDLHTIDNPIFNEDAASFKSIQSKSNTMQAKDKLSDDSPRLQDFVNSDREVTYNLYMRDGNVLNLTRDEYNIFIEKSTEKLFEWLDDEKRIQPELEYEKLVLAFMKTIA